MTTFWQCYYSVIFNFANELATFTAPNGFGIIYVQETVPLIPIYNTPTSYKKTRQDSQITSVELGTEIFPQMYIYEFV